MTSHLAGQTENFYWEKSSSNLLGQGICGTVYKGLNKTTGEPVAVKTFNDNAVSRSIEVQTRELDVIRKVNHANIVKLLAIEEEEDGGRLMKRNVIVMELCTGGSLAKILEDPENAFGVDEDEYLLVLEHLMNGIKYLRENNIIHRDLKPGNIMKYVAEDGGSIYKLTDFDAARELVDGQEFMSLYGTEEYLHPDMYEQALLSPVGQQLKRFSESVDLWSIGVTLYHVATGSLPFKPFLHRKDRQMMHNITTQKKTGVISGHQLARNGPIYWNTQLPCDCLLSIGLKTLITPLLAGLMEVNKDFRWDFTRFFAESRNILDRKRLHVFYVNQVNSLRIYLEPEKSYFDLQTSIKEQTGISPENQTLLYKDSTLLSLTGDESGCVIPNTNKLIPIIFCDKENNNIKESWILSKLLFKSFPNTVDKFEDERIATYNCGIGYVYKRQIERICQGINLINSAVLTINQVVVSQLMGVSKENLQVQSVVRSLSNQFEMMKGFHTSCQAFLQCIPLNRYLTGTVDPLQTTIVSMGRTYEKHFENFLELGDRLIKLKPSICQLLGNRVEYRSLLLEWEERSRHIPSVTNITRVEARATTFINKLRSSYEKIRVKQLQLIPSTTQAHDTQTVLHLTERLLMRETCKSISVLCRNEYQEVFLKLIRSFSDWYKSAQIALIQPEILTKVMTELRVELSTCEFDLTVVVKEFQSKLNGFTEAVRQAQTDSRFLSASKEIDSEKQKASKHKDSIRKLNENIQRQLGIQQDLMEQFYINLDICHQFQNLLSESMTS